MAAAAQCLDSAEEMPLTEIEEVLADNGGSIIRRGLCADHIPGVAMLFTIGGQIMEPQQLVKAYKTGKRDITSRPGGYMAPPTHWRWIPVSRRI